MSKYPKKIPNTLNKIPNTLKKFYIPTKMSKFPQKCLNAPHHVSAARPPSPCCLGTAAALCPLIPQPVEPRFGFVALTPPGVFCRMKFFFRFSVIFFFISKFKSYISNLKKSLKVSCQSFISKHNPDWYFFLNWSSERLPSLNILRAKLRTSFPLPPP